MLRSALKLSLLTTAAALMVTPVAEAQQIASTVRGTVTTDDGAAIAGATVTIRDTRTGRTTVRATDKDGAFLAPSLQVGGPYTVTVESSGYQSRRIEGVQVSLGSTTDLSVQLDVAGQAIEEMVVTASSIQTVTQLAVGPSSLFTETQIEALPSIGRDFRDILRLDPRVTVNPGGDNAISCGGNNNRFNTYTIDGVNVTDGFGLNASGLPSRNTTPVPLDATREVSVEFAPFDVGYGQFTGCNINLVTKSGTNEFHGSAFGVYNNEGLTGSSIDGETVNQQPFDDWNWGAELGGPIIKDKLFFYVAYEETDDADIQIEGPAGASGFANSSSVTLSQVEEIQEILETTYGQNTGGIQRTLPESTRRIFSRVDWFINDKHRAEFSYTRVREENTEPDDFGFEDFAFSNNFEVEGSKVDIFSGRLFSQWTDNLTTEIRYSRNDNDDIQGPLGGGERTGSGDFVNRFLINTGNGTVISGPGFSRSTNQLNTTRDQVRIKADYTLANHHFTAGYELDRFDVFNAFLQNSVGTLEFNSIDDLRNGILNTGSRTDTGAADSFSGDITDAAADFARSLHSIYLQDEWQATPDLSVTLGLRYDFYTSGDSPTRNPRFVERYGFDNTQAYDGLDILMPRLGITYDAPWDFAGQTTFRAGAGVFSGGDPTVWFSNAFTNFGASNGRGRIVDPACTAADAVVLDANGNFTGFPSCIFQSAQQQALGNNGPVDAVDPNFKLPSVVRGNFGFTHFTDFGGAASGVFDDWTINFDVMHTRRRNAPDVIDLTLTPVGFAPDGRPIFNRIDALLPGCNATFVGPRDGYSGPRDQLAEGGACDDPTTDQDTLLTNVRGSNGGDTSVTIRFDRGFDYTMFDKPGGFNVGFGYTYVSAKDVNPTTSSTAGSNVEEVALSVVNNAPLANSSFLIRHNLVVNATWRQDFFRDLTTSVGLVYRATEGNPFSYTFNDRTTENLFGDTDNEARQLLFVPTGPNDPRFDFSQFTQGEVNAFFAALEAQGLNRYAGQISPRNAFFDPWQHDLDLRFQQDLPTFFEGHRFQFFVDIENVLNLINDSWNLRERYDRGDVGEAVPLIGATLSDDGGTYIVNELDTPVLQRTFNASLWSVQFGLRYEF
ncbi:TonB-dependent receptor-like protein [Rhodothalassium salexigens DSM 2132]|uniref:TonB-dependent receptor-like protein n=1 Tax=Rhodothalassium salexigens DSM 2132 TaxID=1188247 RepID=A0A4R2PGH9_RHOSA|nr:TonB-dependent receptor [Rhodothalassium salexigens]MBB4211606.1 outer membrane receptor for ferrienterochelin and colicin [Rhodothalassium salexigens DSM 2132]MBK1639557.1 hypothetical protein [Rhodothalassium salexigens DSM 2132]TCP34462.1 TonB-dependent receptor-like protein [Rhodothalassium salexigens DSM 2132]